MNVDSAMPLAHGLKSKKLVINARTKTGRPYKLKYKIKDENTIIIKNRDTIPLKLTITPKLPSENSDFMKKMQYPTRFLMMLRSVSVSYRNTYNLTVPGFLPEVGDMLGQRKLDGIFSPGVAFAFGFVDDSYLDDAKSKGLNSGGASDGELLRELLLKIFMQ